MRALQAVVAAVAACDRADSDDEVERVALSIAWEAIHLAMSAAEPDAPPDLLERLKDAKGKLDRIPPATKGEQAHPRLEALKELHRWMDDEASPTPTLLCSIVDMAASQRRRGATWLNLSMELKPFAPDQLRSAQAVIDNWHRSKWRPINALLAHWGLEVEEPNRFANEHPLSGIWRRGKRRTTKK